LWLPILVVANYAKAVYIDIVNVIAFRTIRNFLEHHPEAEPVMREWYNRLCKSEPQNFADLRAMFVVDVAHVKNSEAVFIFDVGGNKYRILCAIVFTHQVSFIKHVFTHTEYDIWNNPKRKRKN
jgi:mRNA interferase HigB